MRSNSNMHFIWGCTDMLSLGKAIDDFGIEAVAKGIESLVTFHRSESERADNIYKRLSKLQEEVSDALQNSL